MARYILLAVFALFTAINGTLGTGPVWRRLLCVSPALTRSSCAVFFTRSTAFYSNGSHGGSTTRQLCAAASRCSVRLHFAQALATAQLGSNSQCSSSMLIFSDGHEGVGVIGSACSPLPVGPDVLAANESTRSLIDTPHTTDASDRQLITSKNRLKPIRRCFAFWKLEHTKRA